MSVDCQNLYYKTELVSPEGLDAYTAQRRVLSSIEAYLAFRSAHSRLDDLPVPVYSILTVGNPNARVLYAQYPLEDILRPDELTSPFVLGTRYPKEYAGGLRNGGETSLISFSEVGEGTELAPQYFAFDYDEGQFTCGECLSSRWHISGSSIVEDGRCRTSLQLTWYMTDESLEIEPPDSYHDKLLDCILEQSTFGYCTRGDTPVFPYALTLDAPTTASAEPDGAGDRIERAFGLPLDLHDFERMLDGSILADIEAGDTRHDLVNYLTATKWNLFNEMLRDANRTLPIVLVCSDRDGVYPISPDRLQRYVKGMANVFSADVSNQAVKKELNRLFRRRGPENQFRCRPGFARVYPGGISLAEEADSELCPMFRASEAWVDEEWFDAGYDTYPAIVRLILSYQRAASNTPVDVAGLARMRARKAADWYREARDALAEVSTEDAIGLDEQVAGKGAASRQLMESELMVTLLTEELEKVSALYNGAQRQLSEMSRPDQRVEQYYVLEKAQRRHRRVIQELTDGQRMLTALDRGLPESVDDILTCIEETFPERVVVLPEAHDSAKRHGRRNLRDAWAILRNVPTTLWSLHFEDAHDVEREFRDATGYELALTERKATKANGKMMKVRKLAYGDDTIDITPHIKGGLKGDPLRVHYGIDGVNRLIVIGHCGDHLPTSGGGR